MQIPSLKEVKERKLVRWALAYLAGAWLVLQVMVALSSVYGWPAWLLRAVPVALVVGFFVALVVAWYHGERGAQRVSGVEAGILTALLVIAGAAVALVGDGDEAGTPGIEAAEPAGVLAAPEAGRASVAVLPFEQVGTDEDYFADGLTDELLNTLARVPGLRVAARTSAFAFKGADAPADSIGRALGVAHLVEGSVRRAGERVRVAAQLVDAGTGFRAWAETYDREVTDVFAVQEEIARAVARELRIRVGGDPLAEAGTADAAAYEAVLRGRVAQERREGTAAEWVSAAARAYEEALRRDSTYAAAWAGLAQVRIHEAYRDLVPDPDTAYAAARARAEHALALDPGEGEAHYALGFIAYHHDRDYAAAAEHYVRAVEANPSDARALASLGWALYPLGREAEALRAAERAIELDPLSVAVLNNAASVYIFARQRARALELFQAAADLSPDNASVQGNLAVTLSELGQHAEAVQHAERAVALAPEHRALSATLALTYARAGRRAEAERALAEVPEDMYSLRAQTAWALGERDEAFALLERGVEAEEVVVEDLWTSADYDDMRGDPRWGALLARAAEAAAEG